MQLISFEYIFYFVLFYSFLFELFCTIIDSSRSNYQWFHIEQASFINHFWAAIQMMQMKIVSWDQSSNITCRYIPVKTQNSEIVIVRNDFVMKAIVQPIYLPASTYINKLLDNRVFFFSSSWFEITSFGWFKFA